MMTVKKRILETIISLLLIIAMALSLTGIFLSKNLSESPPYNKANVLGLYAEPDNSLDMVYIGGSACFVYWEALRAWQTHGFTSYNFAVDMLTPQSIQYSIQEIQKTQRPRVWVIDLRPFQYGDDPHGSNPDILNMYHDTAVRNISDNMRSWDVRCQFIDASVPDKSERIFYYIPFLKYHSQLTTKLLLSTTHLITGTRSEEDLTLFDNGIKENRLKGFHFIPKTTPVPFTDYSNVSQILALQGTINEYFLSLLDYCKTSSITPLFIVHSYSQKEEHKQKFNYMAQVIESYGFDYLNMNDHVEQIGLNYSFDFYNEDHVNIFGAEKYTDFLASYLKKHYDMPDHRTDPAYSGWDNCAKEFEAKVLEVKQAILAQEEG